MLIIPGEGDIGLSVDPKVPKEFKRMVVSWKVVLVREIKGYIYHIAAALFHALPLPI